MSFFGGSGVALWDSSGIWTSSLSGAFEILTFDLGFFGEEGFGGGNNGASIGMDCVLVKRDGCALSASILANSTFNFLISASFLLNSGP